MLFVNKYSVSSTSYSYTPWIVNVCSLICLLTFGHGLLFRRTLQLGLDLNWTPHASCHINWPCMEHYSHLQHGVCQYGETSSNCPVWAGVAASSIVGVAEFHAYTEIVPIIPIAQKTVLHNTNLS